MKSKIEHKYLITSTGKEVMEIKAVPQHETILKKTQTNITTNTT